MRQDFRTFNEAKRTLSIIHDRCSEILFDPDATEERKAEALAFRLTIGGQYDASDGAHSCRVRAEAINRARLFFGEPGFKG